MKTKIVSLGAVAGLTLALPVSAAAVTTLSGGVSTGYEYFDREYDQSGSSDNNDYSRFNIAPFVTINSESARQSIEFTYKPTFWYDVDESENDTNHDLSLDYLRALTQYWNVSLSDNLRISDQFNSFGTTVDPESGEIISGVPGEEPSGDVLRDERGRRRYQLNTLQMGTAYTYLEDSTAAFDYAWTTLRNDKDFSGSNYQDYDKHDFSLTEGHRFNSRWKATATAGLIKGFYESVEDDSDAAIPADSDDLDAYRASLLVEHGLSPLHTLSGYYAYYQSDYESDLRSDNEIHDLTLIWGWLVSPKLNMQLGAGPTYTKVDGESGDWGTNGIFDLNYLLERGMVGLKASHGTRPENFSGTGERGTTEFWTVQTHLRYAVLEHTNLTAYANYANEDRHDTTSTGATEKVTEDIYSLGCGLDHRFRENYVAALTYGYVRNDSDDDSDDYDDHRITVTLSYDNDFFQW